MAGGMDLDVLITAMRPTLDARHFVYVTTQKCVDSAALRPVMVFEEVEGTTLILEAATAKTHGLESVFACRMITLNVHSSLEAVGFIAKIASRLAAAGMGVNPVSGYFHDHLFIAEDQAAEAMALLEAMAADT